MAIPVKLLPFLRPSRLAIAAFLFSSLGVSAQDRLGPPVAATRPVTETYYGVSISDPYRYIENLKDPEVDAWFKGQDAFTRSVLKKIPGREALLKRIQELDRSAPAKVADVNFVPAPGSGARARSSFAGYRYFYRKMLASEIVSKLYVRDGLDGKERLLLDPANYPAPTGSHNAINYYAPSWDGKLVAVGVSAGGSENATIHIVDVENGKEYPETIDRALFGNPGWLTDNHSLFYNRLRKLAPGQPETEREQRSVVYVHVVGTSVDTDTPVFAIGLSPRVEMAPTDLPFAFATTDGRWAIGFIAHGVLNEVTMYKAPLESVTKPEIPWEKICDVPDEVTGFAIHGDQLYLQTHKGAPHFKIIRTSLSRPDISAATTVVPESDHVIKNVAAAQDALYVQETDGTLGILKRVSYQGGTPEQIPLPFEGTAAIASTDERIPGALLVLTSWARAPRIDSFDPTTGTIEDTKLQPLGPNDDPQDVVTEEVKAKSWDGAMVPLSIVHKRGLKMDGSNPALLKGYGSYGISIDPAFAPTTLAWLEEGGVYAWAHPRGGGELGEDWHKAGQKVNKPNTWRDFIACAEFLVDKHYTSSAKLGGEGTSAGGITIGRAITERPDLFAAALDRVGVSNAVRGEETPNGPPNIPEFGTVKTQWGFEDLYAMDAYLHVHDGVKYPAVLVTTGWNDPRVASWEPGKMAARLQAASASGKPVLLRVDYAGGHGFGSTKEQNEEQTADEWSFLLWQFGVDRFQPNAASVAQK